MSSTIDEYKIAGSKLINTIQFQNEINSISKSIHSIQIFDCPIVLEKTWSDYNEYILDTLDYLQLHQEDLREFYQLANDLLTLFNEKELQFDKNKLYEQIELLDRKGGLLLQNSAINSNDNQIERLLETIHRNYDNLTELSESNDIQRDLDELHFAMNDLSELIVSSTTDIISAQPIKLAEQLVDNTVVANELEKRRISLEQLHSKIQMMNNQEDFIFEEKLTKLNEDWLIMKQANDLHGENLLLTQTCANQFWSEYNEFPAYLEDISKKLLEIHPSEQNILNQLFNDFTLKKQTFQEYSLQLLTLISNNQQETDDIQCSIYELEQKWNHIQIDFNICRDQLSESMIKSTEFNAKLESVSTWFDETSLLSTSNNDFEHIRIVKEHLDRKYIDIVNLKQDYIDIEDKTNLVEEQLIEIDSKWTQLNDQIQEQ